MTNQTSENQIKAQALEEAARDLSWLGAQGNTPEPNTAWAGVCASMRVLENIATALRAEAPDVHTEGEQLVQQIHELHAIKTRLEEDRAEYAGSDVEDQSIRDRDRLLQVIKNQATRLGAIDQLHTREAIAGHEGHGNEYWCPACATYWPCNTTKAILGGN